MSENTGLGILVHCTSRGRRGTLEPVMRYFVAGAGLGRFRSLIPCACHATDSQHTVNTTEVGNTIRVGSKTAVKCATTAVVPDIMHVIVDQKLCAEVEQHKLDGINNFDSGHRLVNSLYISHNQRVSQLSFQSTSFFFDLSNDDFESFHVRAVCQDDVHGVECYTQSTRQSTRALFLRILSRSAFLDSCSPNSSLRLEILKFPHATRVLLENSQEKCSC